MLFHRSPSRPICSLSLLRVFSLSPEGVVLLSRGCSCGRCCGAAWDLQQAITFKVLVPWRIPSSLLSPLFFHRAFVPARLARRAPTNGSDLQPVGYQSVDTSAPVRPPPSCCVPAPTAPPSLPRSHSSSSPWDQCHSSPYGTSSFR